MSSTLSILYRRLANLQVLDLDLRLAASLVFVSHQLCRLSTVDTFDLLRDDSTNSRIRECNRICLRDCSFLSPVLSSLMKGVFPKILGAFLACRKIYRPSVAHRGYSIVLVTGTYYTPPANFLLCQFQPIDWTIC